MSLQQHGDVVGSRLRPPVGLGWCADFPPLPFPVLQLLGRLPVGQDIAQVAGRPLWLPRLAVTVLPQERTSRGWLCTLAGGEARRGRLPTGVCRVFDVEVAAAATAGDLVWPSGLSTGVPDLNGELLCATWRIRLATVDGSWLRIGEAITAVLDPVSHTIPWQDRALAARAGFGRSPAGYRAAACRLAAAGFLTACWDDITPEPERRWGLTVPPSAWPGPC